MEYILQNPERRTIDDVARYLYFGAQCPDKRYAEPYSAGGIIDEEPDANAYFLVFSERPKDLDQRDVEEVLAETLFELRYIGSATINDRPERVTVVTHNPTSKVSQQVIERIQRVFDTGDVSFFRPE